MVKLRLHSLTRLHGIVHRDNFTFFTLTLLLKLKLNSVALVRERTILTERSPPLLDEVSAKSCG
jgi:hypothetical protein